jgi:hypothetical protein
MAGGKYGDSSARDLSDWGRPIARFFAKKIEHTPITVIQVTNFHLLLSILCAWLIIENNIIKDNVGRHRGGGIMIHGGCEGTLIRKNLIINQSLLQNS